MHDVFLVETRDGRSWEIEAELYDGPAAWKHKQQIVREFDFDSQACRVVAFLHGDGADVFGAVYAWAERRDSGKPCGRKLMRKLSAEFGVTVGFLSGKETVTLSVNGINL